MAMRVQVAERSVYAAGFDSLHAYSLETPFRPANVGTYADVLLAVSVKADGDLAAVGHELSRQEKSELRLVSVAEPRRPREIASITTTANLSAFDMADGLVHLPEGFEGLRIVSVGGPHAPKNVGRLDGDAYTAAVLVDGSQAYVEEHGGPGPRLRIVSIADPERPAYLGTASLSSLVPHLTKSGGYVYLAGWGLSTVWVGDQTAPTEVDHVDGTEYARYIEADPRHLYVSEAERVRVYSLENGARPQQVAVWKTEELFPGRLLMHDGLAFSPLGPHGLSVYAVDDLEGPVELGAYQTYGEARDLCVQGELVYVAAGVEGLVVLRMFSLPRLPDAASVLYLPSLAQPGA
jgi:hypothetical protein